MLAILKKVLIVFAKNIDNVKPLIIKKFQNDIMKIKLKYKTIKNYIMKKREIDYYKNKKIDVNFLKICIDLILNYKKKLNALKEKPRT